MGEIKYNGRTYSGLIQANGCFVDTSNVIASGTWTNSLSYTATEDCFVFIDGDLQNSHLVVNLDGVKIYDLGSSTYIEQMQLYPVRKGQVLTATKSTNYALDYIVYGLLQGSPITFLSEYASACYDTNEREVGCWVDGKPVYQRTLVYTVTSTISSNTVLGSIANLESVAAIECIAHYTGNNRGWLMPLGTLSYSSNISYNNGDIILNIENDTYGSGWAFYTTVQYTKTTDTAGSGQLTPTGFETHHYSTNEQIVGTWINGKPIYERTWDFSASPVMLSYANWVNSGISASENINEILSSELKYGTVVLANVEVGVGTDGYPVGFQKVSNDGNTRGVAYCTLRYTKSTD